MTGRTLWEWFAAAAGRYADEPALDLADGVLTYRELRDCAEVVTGAVLAAHGGAPARVALLASRSVVSFAGYLAAARLGAAVVPLNPAHPAHRNETICAALPCDVLIADDADPGGLSGSVDTVLRLADAGVRAGRPGPLPEPAARLDDVAYVLFTSGSTGRPKGVPITHANVSAYVAHNIERFGIEPGCRVSHTFELTFDPSVFDLFVTWGGGGTLVSPDRTDLLSPVDFLADRAVTHWFSVPSVISVCANLGNLPAGRDTVLRQSIFIGEQLTYGQAVAWRAIAPEAGIANVYGPTELTVACTEYRLPADPTTWPPTTNSTVPIGPVYDHLDHVVVGEDGRPADEGELCVRGAQRFAGYLDPADNTDRFLTLDGDTYVPTADTGPESYYRTGDRVRREHGELVHLSRWDDQVKIRGHRVELGEVEAAVARHPSVIQAVVVAVSQDDGAELVAFYTGTPQPDRELIAWLRDYLPIQLVPRELHHRESLPLNVNGKIDRHALRG